MRILVLHSLSESFVGYSRAIDHAAHEVTYVGRADRLRLVPADLPLRKIARSEQLDTASGVLSAIAGLPKPDRVIALSEMDLEPAAQVRETLGIDGRTVKEVAPVRDKLVMKTAVHNAGVRVPRFSGVYNPATVHASDLAWSGPTVIKPVAGTGSRQTSVHPSTADATSALNRGDIDVSAEAFELEEYIDGSIIHVDGLVADSQPVVVQASRYIGTCLDYAAGSPLGSVQFATEPDLVAWTLRCLTAVGIVDGPFHLEAIESRDGWVFLEVAARCSGTGMEEFELATGLRLPTEAVRLEIDGRSRIPAPRIPDPDRLYASFNYPAHTIGTSYCRISGEDPFRTDPRVVRWYQRGPVEPVNPGFTYSIAKAPLGGLIGPDRTEALERYLMELFSSVRVKPRDCS